MEERAEKHPRNEKRDHRVAFFVSGVVVGGGRVSQHTRHENTTLGSRFHVRGVRNHPDMKNVTLGSRSLCLGGRKWWEGQRNTPDMKNTTRGSHFHVWGVSNIPDTKSATHMVALFVSEW